MSSSPSAHRRVARFIFFLQCAGGGGHRWPTPTEFLSSDRRRFCVGQMQQKFGQMCLIVNFFEFFNRCMYVSVYLGHYASCIFFCCGTTKLATAQVMLHLRGHYGDLATSFLLRQSVCTRESFWPGQFSEFSFVFFCQLWPTPILHGSGATKSRSHATSENFGQLRVGHLRSIQFVLQTLYMGSTMFAVQISWACKVMFNLQVNMEWYIYIG